MKKKFINFFKNKGRTSVIFFKPHPRILFLKGERSLKLKKIYLCLMFLYRTRFAKSGRHSDTPFFNPHLKFLKIIKKFNIFNTMHTLMCDRYPPYIYAKCSIVCNVAET